MPFELKIIQTNYRCMEYLSFLLTNIKKPVWLSRMLMVQLLSSIRIPYPRLTYIAVETLKNTGHASLIKHAGAW